MVTSKASEAITVKAQSHRKAGLTVYVAHVVTNMFYLVHYADGSG